MPRGTERVAGRGYRLPRRTVLRGGAVMGGALIGSAVVGCGDDDSPAATSAPSTSSAAAGATGTTALQPKAGGTVVMNHIADAANLDVHGLLTSALYAQGAGMAYSRLLRYKVAPSEVPSGVTGEVAPDLAQSYEQADDTTLIFKIRPNAKFQDIAPVSGRAATADDVVYSFGRIADLKVNASLLPNMESVTAVDPMTLRIKLKGVQADAVSSIAYFTNKIVAKEAVAVNGDLKNGPTIGTGPWILENWTPKEITRLKKNPNYFLPGLPYLDGVHWLRITDPTTYFSALTSGQLNRLDGSLPSQVKQLKGDQKYIPEASKYGGTAFLMKIDTPPFNDPRIREAVFRAMDYSKILDIAYEGEGYWTTGFSLPSPDWELPESELKERYKPDPARAKALLAEAGQPNLTFDCGWANTAGTPIVQLIQQQLKAVGITLNIVELDTTGYTANVGPQNKFPVLLAGQAIAANATAEFAPRFRSDGSRNASRIADPKLDALIDKQSVTLDAAQRKPIITELQRYLFDNNLLRTHGQPRLALRTAPFLGVEKVYALEADSWTRGWLNK